MTNENWRLNGVCREVDPEIFFPNPSDRRGTLDAMAVCFTCPVMAQCRKWAEDTHQGYGVWGAKYFGDSAPPVIIEGLPPVTGPGQHNANKTECSNGHTLAGDNVRVYMRGGKPMRQCVICNRIRSRTSSNTDSKKMRAERRARAAELAAAGVAREAIASRLGVNLRTVERDLAASA